MHSLPTFPPLSRDRGEPAACYARWRASLVHDEALLLVEFELRPYWLEAAAPLALTAIYCVSGDSLGVAVTDRQLVAEDLPPSVQYARWLSAHGLVSFDPERPIGLGRQTIDKPWGRELWYTGVERRGVCHFTRGAARTPIPWLQAALPAPVAGLPGEALLLLKVLDPSAHPVLGDLYFELHEEKREVYVVTHVDRGAWPDGVGYIRYGFDQQRLAGYRDDRRFRDDYLAAVLAYESVRRELDQLPGRGEVAQAGQLAREAQLREHMHGFTRMQPVREGDVVQVPLMVPHALQHGVRTVEFQTPSYERKILSFAQQVLTQDHWDSREAVAAMRLDAPEISPPPVLGNQPPGISVEQLADFPDFEVRRVTLAPGVRWQLEAVPQYRLLLVLAGAPELDRSRYQPDQALLLPGFWRGQVAAPEGAGPAVFLLAWPRS